MPTPGSATGIRSCQESKINKEKKIVLSMKKVRVVTTNLQVYQIEISLG